LRVPAGAGIRDDGGVAEGDEVSIYYDPMISKLAAWGRTRSEAIDRMRRALDEYAVDGIRTTLPFFREVIRDQEFIDAKLDTGFIGRFNERRKSVARTASNNEEVTREHDIALIAAALAYQRATTTSQVIETATSQNSWKMSGRVSAVRNDLRTRSNHF
jgi:acetyl/propionyl-CoA carboxylase alpha subunit